MTPTFLEYLRRIEAQIEIGSVLDYRGRDRFLSHPARQRGWKGVGIEPSDHAASIARAKGLDVRTGAVESCELPAESFDLVTMYDVIEHLPDPASTIQRVADLVSPSGILVINTPDSGSALARVLGKNWHLVVPPEHLNLFHRRSLIESSWRTVALRSCR